MKRVIGLGGPFIKAKDPKTLTAWYNKHLGIQFHGDSYSMFNFVDDDGKPAPGYNIFSFFKEDSSYFAPSNKDVMINLIVHDLLALIEKLKEEGVELVGELMDGEYGKFIWVLDPEGNKIELWEPPAG